MTEKEKNLNNLKYQISDLLQGDESISRRQDFSNEDYKTLKEGLDLLLKNKNLNEKDKAFYLNNSWKLVYHRKPPTIEEFLSEDWLGSTNEYIYPYIREKLIEFWNPNAEYRHAILSTFIGSGKSYFCILSNLFIEANMVCLRNVKKYFGLSPSSIICLFLISFNLAKAEELYLQPLLELVGTSSKFIRCRTLEQMKNKQQDYPDQIFFTTAGISAVTFSKGIDMKIGSSPSSIIGLSVLSASLSELSFWSEFGYSSDKIWRMFIDTRNRIMSRFKSNFWGRSLIDSSPNDIENSKIDKFIFGGEAEKDKKNFLFRGSIYQWKTWEFDEDVKKFPVFKGSSSIEPKILDEDEVSKYNILDIEFVPYYMKSGVNLYEVYKQDVVKALKDLSGIPSHGKDKLISNLSIIDNMFDDNLQNIYTGIYVPSNKMPERLIFDQIVDKFFIKSADNRYEFYRAPNELRWLGIDQSISGDCAGLSMCHPEVNEKGVNIIVFDFTITIIPTKYKINLQAIYEFILDLMRLGRIKFGGIHFDRFESETTIQNLERKELPVFKTSVDISKDPYNLLVSYMQNNRVKAGRSIFFKNNLKSLEEVTLKTKTKIDHSKGKVEYNGDEDWKTSIIGLNAKDTSDSACNSFYFCSMNYKGVPRYQYIENHNKQSMKENVLKFLDDKYSFKV